MDPRNFASLVTIHGSKIFLKLFTSATCLNGFFCTSCHIEKHRIFENENCKCEIRFFDDGENEECQKCHYSWYFLYLLILLVILAIIKLKVIV